MSEQRAQHAKNRISELEFTISAMRKTSDKFHDTLIGLFGFVLLSVSVNNRYYLKRQGGERLQVSAIQRKLNAEKYFDNSLFLFGCLV